MSVRTMVMSFLLLSILISNSSFSAQSEFEAFMDQQQEDLGSEQAEFSAYKKELEAGFAAYQQIYQEEFSAYKAEIMAQWGEFRDSSRTRWVSYAQNGEVRRSVDYETGRFEIDLLIDEKIDPAQVQQNLDKQIYLLLNSSESDAFQSDKLAQKVEKRLLSVSNLVEQGKPSEKRLFPMENLTSLRINNSGFYRVSSVAGNAVEKNVLSSPVPGKKIVKASFEIPESLLNKALRYAESVQLAAEKEKIPSSLIFAVMETESSFNPMAKSGVPAYGLMQIVPRSAGKDATKYLHGKPRILAPSYLYVSDNNITIGSAYLHVLYYKYMRKVKDPTSRLYCTIAAYNTGPGNVAKAFINIRNFGRAVKKINSLKPEQVYDILYKQLPHRETRHYVEKVSTRMEKYL